MRLLRFFGKSSDVNTVRIRDVRVGDTVKVVSWPRIHDGADAYAGTIGVVDEIETKEKFRDGNVGCIFLRLPSGAVLGGVGLNRLKLELIKRGV